MKPKSTVLVALCVASVLVLIGCQQKEAPDPDETAMPGIGLPGEAAEVAEAAVEKIKAEAQKWMDEAGNLIAENRLDDAKALMDKLSGIEDKLPEDVKKGYADLKKAYETARERLAGTE